MLIDSGYVGNRRLVLSLSLQIKLSITLSVTVISMESFTMPTFHSNRNPAFRSAFSEAIFNNKYSHDGCETWDKLCHVLAHEVCDGLLPKSEVEDIAKIMEDMAFIPGGRYLFYAGRKAKFYNNCFLLKAEEDSREDWANLSWKAESCLMTGGGIGVDYSIYRPSGSPLGRTGGVASGPLPKISMINEIGRNVIQGGSRRSAIYASLNWRHGDIHRFLTAKNWHDMRIPGTNATYADAKQADFNFHAPLDMSNISVNYDDAWLAQAHSSRSQGQELPESFLLNCLQALSTGEPGFSFNFGSKEKETLRNACTEVTSEDDSDVCNLGSVNLSRIPDADTLKSVVELATKFLLCGTLKADLPYQRVYAVRDKNRRLGLGLMGLHEWLLQRGSSYQVTPELHQWLSFWRSVSDTTASKFSDHLQVSRPVAVRAVAPTGSIAILAGTTTGVEPLFAVAYKRRYLKGSSWVHQYVVDAITREVTDRLATNPDTIETASNLADKIETRISLQAELQSYTDQAISSTINLPAWGSDANNPDKVKPFAELLAKYAHRLRGLTVYPDGSRGGQPLTPVTMEEARGREGEEFTEEAQDICLLSGKGGHCGA